MTVLRTLWAFAAEGRDPTLPPTNPVGRLKGGWYEIEARKRMVTDDDMPAFYKAVCGLENRIQRDYLKLLLFTGLRRTEAASLVWSDVDFGQKVIRIPKERTKGRRELILPMTDVVHALLVERRQLGKAKFVFPANSRSGHLEDPALWQVEKACGVRVSPHDLRRTYATAANKSKIPWLELKMLVNHAVPKSEITADYTQITVDDLRESAQRVADRLKELCRVAPLPDNVASMAAASVQGVSMQGRG
jgi:integrase